MNWPVIILACIAICICVAVSDAQQKQQQSETAKLPKALAELLGEEFPDFKASFTYAACLRVTTWVDSIGGSLSLAPYVNFMGDQVKSGRARDLGLYLADKVAPAFSPSFVEHMRNNPEDSAHRFMRALTAARTLAKA